MSHGASGGRPKKHHEEEHENHERWAVSYADMMTVLLALFIVLYAISVVDKTKFDELRVSLAKGFGNAPPIVIEGAGGAMLGMDTFSIGPDFTGLSGTSAEDINPATALTEEAKEFLEAAKEFEQLSDIEQSIQAELIAAGLDANVTFKISERGLLIQLVGSDVFFAPDQAALTPTAQSVVNTLASSLRDTGRQLSIEGHADTTPSSNYATNWELSSARATAVLRQFVESGGVPADKISATGFGDARPAVAGTTPEALSANRRVDIVVESTVAEQIRALLPIIAQGLADGTLTQEDLRAQLEAGDQALAAEIARSQETTAP